MKTIFGIVFLTKKDIAVFNGIIDGVAEGVHERVAKQESEMFAFRRKFAEATDFIGRNLPLKRKRKAFRKIVDA